MKQTILTYLLLLTPMAAFAGSSNHYNETTTVVEKQTVIVEKSTGVALGIAAAQHQFDLSTYSWQGSVAVGNFDSETAFSLGVGKRICSECALVSGSLGMEDGEVGYGASINWKF